MTAPRYSEMARSSRRTIEERFWVHVVKSPGCWRWTGPTNYRGYGQIRKGGAATRNLLAHRVSWALHRGPIPEGLCVLHRCDDPPCTNPDHLWLGTIEDNNRDSRLKGRHYMSRRSACSAGHPYIEGDSFSRYRGKRVCLICQRAKRRRAMRLCLWTREKARAARRREREVLVASIRERASGGESLHSVGNSVGLSYKTIYQIVHGRKSQAGDRSHPRVRTAPSGKGGEDE
jgi:hypothetical protein